MQGSPLRDLADAVPEEGVPKYDFLRDALKGAAEEPTTGQTKSGSFLNISRPEGKFICSVTQHAYQLAQKLY